MGLHHRGNPVWPPELFGVEEEWLCSQLVAEGSQGESESLLTREGVHEKGYTGLLADRQPGHRSFGARCTVMFSQGGGVRSEVSYFPKLPSQSPTDTPTPALVCRGQAHLVSQPSEAPLRK